MRLQLDVISFWLTALLQLLPYFIIQIEYHLTEHSYKTILSSYTFMIQETYTWVCAKIFTAFSSAFILRAAYSAFRFFVRRNSFKQMKIGFAVCYIFFLIGVIFSISNIMYVYFGVQNFYILHQIIRYCNQLSFGLYSFLFTVLEKPRKRSKVSHYIISITILISSIFSTILFHFVIKNNSFGITYTLSSFFETYNYVMSSIYFIIQGSLICGKRFVFVAPNRSSSSVIRKNRYGYHIGA